MADVRQNPWKAKNSLDNPSRILSQNDRLMFSTIFLADILGFVEISSVFLLSNYENKPFHSLLSSGVIIIKYGFINFYPDNNAYVFIDSLSLCY